MMARDSIHGLLDQVASLEKNVMTIVFEATHKLSLLTNCKSFLMFESQERRFYSGSEELCFLYASDQLRSRPSDEQIVGSSAQSSRASPSFFTDSGIVEIEEVVVAEREANRDPSSCVEGEMDKPEESSVPVSDTDDDIDETDDDQTSLNQGTNQNQIDEPPKKAKCHVCNKQGFTDSDLANHMRNYHKGAFLCLKCHHSFRSQAILTRHLASKHDIGSSKFLCLKCSFCTIRKDNMKAHMLRKHPDTPNLFTEVDFHMYDRTYTAREKRTSKGGNMFEAAGSLLTKGQR